MAEIDYFCWAFVVRVISLLLAMLPGPSARRLEEAACYNWDILANRDWCRMEWVAKSGNVTMVCQSTVSPQHRDTDRTGARSNFGSSQDEVIGGKNYQTYSVNFVRYLLSWTDIPHDKSKTRKYQRRKKKILLR